MSDDGYSYTYEDENPDEDSQWLYFHGKSYSIPRTGQSLFSRAGGYRDIWKGGFGDYKKEIYAFFERPEIMQLTRKSKAQDVFKSVVYPAFAFHILDYDAFPDEKPAQKKLAAANTKIAFENCPCSTHKGNRSSAADGSRRTTSARTQAQCSKGVAPTGGCSRQPAMSSGSMLAAALDNTHIHPRPEPMRPQAASAGMMSGQTAGARPPSKNFDE